MRRPHLGDQELEVLRFIAEHGPLTVGRATEGFGTPRGLSRSTVKTVMERLHRKGYLSRMQDGGVFHYACQVPQEELVGGLVQQFIEKTLA
ncbi:MAG TPA: BlaI/MecI/CopY family transcriptional regulator, partial [Chthonomonadales bacterium]|nr:BlaI/MecI/CopY family transcriptional regulator [Chthonomonadales bacterium]